MFLIAYVCVSAHDSEMNIEITKDEFEEILNAMKVIRKMLVKEHLPTLEVENLIAKLDAIKEATRD